MNRSAIMALAAYIPMGMGFGALYHKAITPGVVCFVISLAMICIAGVWKTNDSLKDMDKRVKAFFKQIREENDRNRS